MKFPCRISDRSISVLIDNKMKTIHSDHSAFKRLREELAKPDQSADVIRECVDLTSFIARVSFGKVQISDDQVRYNGNPVGEVIATRLLAMVKNGDDPEPLALFLDLLMQNPLESARNELYLWLEAGHAPFTPDGHFLAFKKVRDNFRDCHSGKFDNSPGKIVEMPREQVDTDRARTCSTGLHFCQHGYLSCFSGQRTIIVKINPADVVSIPCDYNNQKGRAWRYEVVGEVDNDTAKNKNHFKDVHVDRRYEAKPPVPPTEQQTAIIKLIEEWLEVDGLTLDSKIAGLASDDRDHHDVVHKVERKFDVFGTIHDYDENLSVARLDELLTAALALPKRDPAIVAFLTAEVSEIVESHLGVESTKIKPESKFMDDLGADSLDVVELVMAAEERFSIEVSEEDANHLLTVGEAVSHVYDILRREDRLAEFRSGSEGADTEGLPVVTDVTIPSMGDMVNKSFTMLKADASVREVPKEKPTSKAKVKAKPVKKAKPAPKKTVAKKAAPKPKSSGLGKEAPMIFKTSDGREFTANEIKSKIRNAGSIRAAARDLNMGKSTLAAWVKRIDADA